MPYVPKATKATTDGYPFEFDFSGWPQLTDDDIASAVASATPSGLTVGTPTLGTGADEEKIFVPLSGGTDGVTYRVTVVATTDAGSTMTGFLDLEVSDSGPDGQVIYPSMLVPYVDSRRLMQLLYDDDELDEGENAPPVNTIDGNLRAVQLSQSAWQDVLSACQRGDVYSTRELTDLANDPVRGHGLLKLVADLFWMAVIGRRRYVTGEPQSEDPADKRSQRALQLLQEGTRIFVLDGVAKTDADGNRTGEYYGNELGEPTTMVTGTLGSNQSSLGDVAFFRCARHRWDDHTIYDRYSGNC